MKFCKDCLCFKDCQRLGQTADFPVDDGVCLNFVQMTNADRIRAMSDEELAKKIPCPYIKNEYDECKFGWHERTQTCEECALEWLRMTANN